MTADLVAVQRAVADALRRGCKAYNGKKPIIKVIAHEFDPRCVAGRALVLISPRMKVQTHACPSDSAAVVAAEWRVQRVCCLRVAMLLQREM